MCGITGFIGKGDKASLERMTAALRHRGPDDSGTFFDEKKEVGLGHARLSILDLTSAGHQPMWSAEGDIAVVFNGEIYNHVELRREIAEHGHFAYKSSSDTETIVYAYKVWGEQCFARMEGMFAIAVYDFKKRRLVLARDRAGKKPLYWMRSGDTVAFASELKSLVLHPLFQYRIDVDSVAAYLQFDYVPTPHTIWRDVCKLEPATYAVFEGRSMRKTEYWQANLAVSTKSFEDAARELDELIKEAVRKRLVSDVPLGIFLSGGLDSSIVAYYAKQIASGPVRTFSIGFEEKSFDEGGFAREVASFLHTEHHERMFTAEESVAAVPEVLASLDEPMADASVVPTYLLSKFTRDSVTVALGGDGGDELFAGYPTFQAEQVASIYGRVPKFLRKNLFEAAANALPATGKNFGIDFRLRKFLQGFSLGERYRHQIWLGSFDKGMRDRLFLPEVSESLDDARLFAAVDAIHEKYSEADRRNRLLYEYERTYMMDEVLVKVDRATMLASLEARSPFLDRKIVEFAHSLPYSYKLHGTVTKYILKRLMDDKLPRHIVRRRKKGFGIPVARWFRGELREMLEEVLSEKNVTETGLFDYRQIARLKNEHASGRVDHRKPLWNLFVLLFWWQKFMKK